MKFITYDKDGQITGFYNDGEGLPPYDQNAKGVTDEEWALCLASPGHRVKDGKLVPPVPAADPQRLAILQVQLCAAIDAQAEAVYGELDVPSPGRFAEYQQTRLDAHAFLSMGFRGAAPPSVAVCAEAHHVSPRVAAQNIIAKAKGWDKRMQAVRAARILGKGRVMVMATDEAAQAAADVACGQLRAILAWPPDTP